MHLRGWDQCIMNDQGCAQDANAHALMPEVHRSPELSTPGRPARHASMQHCPEPFGLCPTPTGMAPSPRRIQGVPELQAGMLLGAGGVVGGDVHHTAFPPHQVAALPVDVQRVPRQLPCSPTSLAWGPGSRHSTASDVGSALAAGPKKQLSIPLSQSALAGTQQLADCVSRKRMHHMPCKQNGWSTGPEQQRTARPATLQLTRGQPPPTPAHTGVQRR